MQDTSPFVNNLNHYLSLATIIGLGMAVVWLLYIGYVWFTKKENKILSSISKYVLPLGFLISLGGMLMSLYYSEFLHFAACDLCWFQRIFMYPQVFLFAYAWYKKERHILPYSLILSIVGIVIAIYHHMLQIGYDIYKPCSSAPFAVDCAKPSFVEFGFVTFPLMAVALFSYLILLVLCTKLTKTK